MLTLASLGPEYNLSSAIVEGLQIVAKYPEASERILMALDDPLYFSKRKHLALALGVRDNTMAVERLIKLITDQESSEMVHMAIWSLCHIGDAQAIKPILDYIDTHPSDLRAVEVSLGMLKKMEEVTISPLMEVIHHNNGTIRALALSSLAQIGYEEVLQPLLDATDDREFLVRLVSAQGLGFLGISNSQVINTLERMKQSEDVPQVLEEINTTLEKLRR